MIIQAYAKINLSLDITNKRENSYHDIDTVMQRVSLCDNVEITKNKLGTIDLSCSKLSLPTDVHNIAFKAAVAFFEHFKIQDTGINIHIVKNIPVEAGLGGGSADAAAVLLGLVDIFKVKTNLKELVSIAKKIGADVPFCLLKGAKRCKGIGEIMTDVPHLPKCTILICKPPVGVSTKYAYEISDKYENDNFFGTGQLVLALRTGNLHKICENISNRFDDVLVIPEVTIIKALMCSGGALTASMSGSGSAVFGIFEDEETAKATANTLSDLGSVHICEPI